MIDERMTNAMMFEYQLKKQCREIIVESLKLVLPKVRV